MAPSIVINGARLILNGGQLVLGLPPEMVEEEEFTTLVLGAYYEDAANETNPISRLVTRSAYSTDFGETWNLGSEPQLDVEVLSVEVVSGSFSDVGLSTTVDLTSLPTFPDYGTDYTQGNAYTRTNLHVLVIMLSHEGFNTNHSYQVGTNQTQLIGFGTSFPTYGTFETAPLSGFQPNVWVTSGAIIEPTDTTITIARPNANAGAFDFQLAVYFLANAPFGNTDSSDDSGNAVDIDADPTLDLLHDYNGAPAGSIVFSLAGRQESSFLNTTTVATDSGGTFGNFTTVTVPASGSPEEVLDNGIKIGYYIWPDPPTDPETITWTFSDSGTPGETGGAASARIRGGIPEPVQDITYNNTLNLFVQTTQPGGNGTKNTRGLRTSSDASSWTEISTAPDTPDQAGFARVDWIEPLDRTFVSTASYDQDPPTSPFGSLFYSDDLVAWVPATINTIGGSPSDEFTVRGGFASNLTGTQLVGILNGYADSVWYSTDGGTEWDEVQGVQYNGIGAGCGDWFETINAFVILHEGDDRFTTFDGATFTHLLLETGTNIYWVDCKYIPFLDVFAAVGIDDNSGDTIFGRTATGAADSWTLVNITSQTGMTGPSSFEYINGRVVVAAYDGSIASSTDTDTWAAESVPGAAWSRIAKGNISF